MEVDRRLEAYVGSGYCLNAEAWTDHPRGLSRLDVSRPHSILLNLVFNLLFYLVYPFPVHAALHEATSLAAWASMDCTGTLDCAACTA